MTIVYGVLLNPAVSHIAVTASVDHYHLVVCDSKGRPMRYLTLEDADELQRWVSALGGSRYFIPILAGFTAAEQDQAILALDHCPNHVFNEPQWHASEDPEAIADESLETLAALIAEQVWAKLQNLGREDLAPQVVDKLSRLFQKEADDA